MSHFSVAVFTDGTKTVEQLLAPYQENNMGDCPKEYLEFFDIEEEYKNKYETDSRAMLKTSDGNIIFTWSKEAKEARENGALEVEVPLKALYSTFEDYMESYEGCDGRDSETGRYGYWENPNAKWDYWGVGGRFADVDKIKVKDFDFTPNPEYYKKAERFWEIIVEGQPLKEGEKQPFNFYKVEYYLKRYKNKETYAKIMSLFITYAVITPDGKWHQKGEMGWFGMSSDTADEALDWDMNYKSRFIDTADPEWFLTVVDCHI